MTEDVLVLRGGRATETEAGSVAVLLNDHIVQQSMFDEYYVVHIVLRVRMSVITATNTRISLSLARSLARRRSCYYYVVSMIILCFDVMNTLVHV